MSRFQRAQPGFCCVCGGAGEFHPHSRYGFIHEACMPEYEWRYVLAVLGKPYYEKPPRDVSESESSGPPPHES